MIPLRNPVHSTHNRIARHAHIAGRDTAVGDAFFKQRFEGCTVFPGEFQHLLAVHRIQRWDLTHDRDRAALANHEIDMIAQVAQYLVQTVLPAVYSELHGFTAHFGGAYVAQVDEFLLAAYIVVEGRVSQPEPVGDVLE